MGKGGGQMENGLMQTVGGSHPLGDHRASKLPQEAGWVGRGTEAPPCLPHGHRRACHLPLCLPPAPFKAFGPVSASDSHCCVHVGSCSTCTCSHTHTRSPSISAHHTAPRPSLFTCHPLCLPWAPPTPPAQQTLRASITLTSVPVLLLLTLVSGMGWESRRGGHRDSQGRDQAGGDCRSSTATCCMNSWIIGQHHPGLSC